MNLRILSFLIFGAVGICFANFLDKLDDGVVCIGSKAHGAKIVSSSEESNVPYGSVQNNGEKAAYSWKCWSLLSNKSERKKLWMNSWRVPIKKALGIRIMQLQKLQRALKLLNNIRLKRKRNRSKQISSPPKEKGRGRGSVFSKFYPRMWRKTFSESDEPEY